MTSFNPNIKDFYRFLIGCRELKNPFLRLEKKKDISVKKNTEKSVKIKNLGSPDM